MSTQMENYSNESDERTMSEMEMKFIKYWNGWSLLTWHEGILNNGQKERHQRYVKPSNVFTATLSKNEWTCITKRGSQEYWTLLIELKI